MRNSFILLSFERAISVPLGENGAVTMSREIFNPIWPCLQTRTHTDKWWERKQDSNFLVFTLPHAWRNTISSIHAALPQHMTHRPSGRVKPCTTHTRPYHTQEQARGKRDSLWLSWSGCFNGRILSVQWPNRNMGWISYVNITALFGSAYVSRLILALTTYLIQNN